MYFKKFLYLSELQELLSDMFLQIMKKVTYATKFKQQKLTHNHQTVKRVKPVDHSVYRL